MTSSGNGRSIALRPRARLIRALGDELISSESVAVTELVKNSYDADATDVLLRFVGPLRQGRGCIELIDNGHGMSPETLSGAFLQPATPFRRKKRRTPGRDRRVLGEKGIGRFAVSRLADRLSVSTRESGADIESSLALTWTDFDDDAKFLDEIPIRWDVSSPENLAPGGTFDRLLNAAEQPRRPDCYHGTVLRMENLRLNWTESDFTTLRNSLSRLISPFAQDIPETFRVHLEFPEESQALSGTVDAPDFLAYPHYHLFGRVDSDGAYELVASLRGGTEERLIAGEAMSSSRETLRCGPFDIEIRVWDRDPDSLAPLLEQRGGTLRSLRRDLNDFAGISIYRDGFRVLPYGERDNDWLRLDLRRVQAPTRRLSNNQIVGYITITADDNPELKDQSNREGLLQTAAFDDLCEAVITILNEIEKRRVHGRRKARRDEEASGGLFSGMDLDGLEAAVREHAPNDMTLQRMVADSAHNIQVRVVEIQQVLARYHRLATLGQLVDTILHDGRAPLSKIRADVSSALGALSSRRISPASGVAIKKRLSSIETQADAIAQLFKKIEPFGGRRRGRPRRILLEDVIRDAVALLDSEIARQNIAVQISSTRTVVSVDPAELQTVIFNLVSNSVYWLATLPAGHCGEIAIDVQRTRSDNVEILVSDNGPGVDPEFADRIFEPYFSTKPRGTGLGLTHAGEVVKDYYNGELELLTPGDLGGATFRTTLRYRV